MRIPSVAPGLSDCLPLKHLDLKLYMNDPLFTRQDYRAFFSTAALD